LKKVVLAELLRKKNTLPPWKKESEKNKKKNFAECLDLEHSAKK